MITFILASIYSDVRGEGPCCHLSLPQCARLGDEAEAWMMRGGRWIYNLCGYISYVILYRERYRLIDVDAGKSVRPC